MNSIVALYDDAATAAQVAKELSDYGISRNSVKIVDSADASLSSMLTQGGLPADDARYYVEGVRQGGTLVSVRAEENETDATVDIMNRYQPIDVHDRAATWRDSGWSDETTVQTRSTQTSADTMRTDTMRTDTMRTDTMRNRDQIEGETTIPIVEEEIRVGKRQVAGGGVRVNTHMEERPVEEQVRLREESVTVERRAVDRPANASDLTTFKEGEFEVSAMREEAVVEKQARIVEEVVIKKQADEHTETIHDTMRRTEVDVEQVTGQPTTTDFGTSDFRTHYQTSFANSGYTYEQYEPAYQYGSTIASDKRYQGRDWNSIEADVRKDWQVQHKDSAWDNFKDAVRHSWEQTKNAVKR